VAELTAQGDGPKLKWRRALPLGETVVLGRADSAFAVPWEKWLSRSHAELSWGGDCLQVRQLPTAGNPIFFRGEPTTTFSVPPGGCFSIGRTIFTLTVAESLRSPSEAKPVLHSYAVTADELQRVPFRDAPHRLEVLRHLTKLIFSVSNDVELFEQTVALLMEGIRRADAIALVSPGEDEKAERVRLVHTEHRYIATGEFRPSMRLAREAIVHRHSSVVHVWSAGAAGGNAQQFTMQADYDWAFCTPLRGEASHGLGIYVAGRLSGGEPSTILAPWDSNDLSEDVKFAEMVSDVLSALRQTQSLQRRQNVLSHFFSPSVLTLLATTDPEAALRPRETEVTVLFCDLRGFSRKVEMAAGDLTSVLERVSKALGVMSTCILEQKGVVADFLGDAAMGFWGWPVSQPDDVQQACQAALRIRASFEMFGSQSDHPLAGFKVGIGIATGHAVAGQIGSQDQAKVTVFGPVVNLASRLEGLTKVLRVPILLDEATARTALGAMPAGTARCRRLAMIKPYGLEQALMVSELLPPASQDPILSDHFLAEYEAALDAFLAGHWSEAYERLHVIPPQDLGKDFLTGYILQQNHTPPAGWNGVISIESKR